MRYSDANCRRSRAGGLGAVPEGTTAPIDQIASFTWSNGDTYTYSADSSTGGYAVYVSPSDPNNAFDGSVSGDTVTWTYNGGAVDTDPSNDVPVGCSYVSCPPRIVKYGYNADGDLTSVTDWPSSIATTYTYETLSLSNGKSLAGVLESETDPDGNVTTFDYYTTASASGACAWDAERGYRADQSRRDVGSGLHRAGHRLLLL